MKTSRKYRMHHLCFVWRAALLLTAAMLLTGGRAEAEEDAEAEADAETPGWVDTFDNAAVDYWRAAALMQPVLNTAELSALAFVEEVVPKVDPRVFALRPESARWLLGERPMLAALNAAGRRSFCYFQPPGMERGRGDASHHRIVGDVTRRALATASAFEFVENEGAAAQTYVDVLRMLDRIDEDMLWVSAYRSTSLLPLVVHEIEGFCSREPPRQALASLSDYLAGLDRPCYPVPAYLRVEAEKYRSWLMKDPGRAEKRLAMIYGGTQLRPGIDKLMTLGPDDKAARLQAWMDGYGEKMDRLAEAVELPYSKARRTIEDIDKEVAKMAEDPFGEGVNPLIPLLMQPFAHTYDQFLAAEATYTMMDILVAASVQRDFTGDWPDDLDDLEQFTGRTFPSDPFTGKPHRYGLSGKLPHVSTKSPKWLVQQTPFLPELDLKERKQRDEKNLKNYVQLLQAERMRTAVPEGPDKPVKK